MSDFLVTSVSLVGTGATQTGSSVRVTNCDKMSYSFIISASSALTTANSTLVLTGTNDDARALDLTLTLPTLTTSTAITALPTGVTLSSGVLTFAFASFVAGTYEICVSYSSFPKWVRPVWTLGGGGGTMTTQVTLSAWSTAT